MEKIFERVATENATTIMTEQMIDLLTNNTRIMDYVDSIGDIEIITDFDDWVEVKTDRFTITYFVNYTPHIEFETGFEFNTIDLSDFCDMLDCNDEVDNIFHSVKEKYV